MKHNLCPTCGCDSLGERWTMGRQLEQYCRDYDCSWRGQPYTPPKRRIINTTKLRIDNFHGWHYIVYDKYGHVSTDSATHDTREEAMKELESDITPKEGYDDPASPYTAVLFNVPSSVTIKGKMFKMKSGKMSSK